MKRLLVILALGLGLAAAAGDARAQPDDPSDNAETAPVPPPPPPPVDPSLLTERHMRKPEVLTEKPSGFWTSNRPAIGGAYRYRMMLIGIVIAAIMGTVIVVVVKRNTRRPA